MSAVPNFSAAQVAALVQCMLAVARVDGLHPKEEALIRGFHAENAASGAAGYDTLAAAPAPALAALAGDAEFAEQLVMSCLMAGYADGQLTDGEKSLVAGYAAQLGVSAVRQGELLQQVKDTLLGSLSHLAVPESVAALAKEL